MSSSGEADWYIIVDQRTGKQACSGIWSKVMAEAKIQEFHARQQKGGRPDITIEDIANLKVIPLSEFATRVAQPDETPRWPQAEIGTLRQWIRETGHHYAVYALESLEAIERAMRRAAQPEAPATGCVSVPRDVLVRIAGLMSHAADGETGHSLSCDDWSKALKSLEACLLAPASPAPAAEAGEGLAAALRRMDRILIAEMSTCVICEPPGWMVELHRLVERAARLAASPTPPPEPEPISEAERQSILNLCGTEGPPDAGVLFLQFQSDCSRESAMATVKAVQASARLAASPAPDAGQAGT